MAWLQQQQQIILRLPEDLARIARKLMYKNKGKANLSISVRPQDASSPSNDFVCAFNDKDYPALLMNLPTPLESHKIFDNKIFLKSGDIGQVLQVFSTENEREAARNSICKTINGDYMPSGLTPPTVDIVKRRFEQTRKNEGNFIPYRIRGIAQEISAFGHGTGTGLMMHAATGEYITDENTQTLGTGVEVVSETVSEEIVDFEEWMVDHAALAEGRRRGVTLKLVGSQLGNAAELQAGVGPQAQALLLLMQHAELLVTEEEREEDDIDALAAEQAREQRRRLRAESEGAMDVDGGSGARGSSSSAGSAGGAVRKPGSAGTAEATAGTTSLRLPLAMLRSAAALAAHGTGSATDTTGAGSTADEDMARDDEGDAVGDHGEGAEGQQEAESEPESAGEDGGDEDDSEGYEGEGAEGGEDMVAPWERATVSAALTSTSASSGVGQVTAQSWSTSVGSGQVGAAVPEENLGEDDEESAAVAGESAERNQDQANDDHSSVDSDDSNAWMREV